MTIELTEEPEHPKTETTPAANSRPQDAIAAIAQDAFQEARMRTVEARVGPHFWQLLFIARNQNAEKLATIGNHGSLAARRARQFVFSADVLLGITKRDVEVPQVPAPGLIQLP